MLKDRWKELDDSANWGWLTTMVFFVCVILATAFAFYAIPEAAAWLYKLVCTD